MKNSNLIISNKQWGHFEVSGKSVKYNQLVGGSVETTRIVVNGFEFSFKNVIGGGIYTINNVSIPAGHKIYRKVVFDNSFTYVGYDNSIAIGGYYYGSPNKWANPFFLKREGTPLVNELIYEQTQEANAMIIYKDSGVGALSNEINGKMQLIDLTTLFGAGNEPTTVAEFYETDLGKIVQSGKYLAHSKGGFVNAETPFNFVGRNLLNTNRTLGTLYSSSQRQFDFDKYYVGLTRNNYYNPNNVSSYSVENNKVIITEKNIGLGYGIAFPIKVKPNTSYYAKTLSLFEFQGGTGLGFGFYDIEGNFLSYTQDENSSQLKQKTFTTPSNCEIMTVVFYGGTNSGENSIVFKDICLQLSSETKTTYVPYVGRKYEPSTPITLRNLGTHPDYGKYQEVEYIEVKNDVNNLYNNGIVIDGKMSDYDKIVFDFKKSYSKIQDIIFCAYSNGTISAPYINITGSDNLDVVLKSFDTSSYSFDTLVYNQRGRLTVNYSTTNTDKIKIGSWQDVNYSTTNCFYNIELYKNNVLKVKLIPCYRKADNVVGMYDIVNNKFYANAGSGTFTKGADVLNNRIDAHLRKALIDTQNNWTGEVSRKLFEIDLGSLNWNNPNEYGRTNCQTQLNDAKGGIDAVCLSKYNYSVEATYNPPTNNTIFIHQSNKYIYICDSAFIGKTGAEVKALLSGIKLICELATPVIEQHPSYMLSSKITKCIDNNGNSLNFDNKKVSYNLVSEDNYNLQDTNDIELEAN